MKFSCTLVVCGFFLIPSLRAVYAPVPDQEQGNDLTFSFRTEVLYDTNIFGAATNEVESTVWQFAPRVSYKASVSAQTFVSAAYGLTLDYFDRRPGEKTLDSHNLSARLTHTFSSRTNFDLNEVFVIAKNPESLLAGLPLNTDQSYHRNQLDGRFTTALSPKLGTTFKARTVYYHYRNAALGRDIDRVENLYGLSGDYAFLPEAKAVAEYRHQDVFYRKEGELKNKKSDYLMGGLDFDVAKKVSLSGRLGCEWRHRESERSTTAPFAEASGKFVYLTGSFLSGGYAYTLEETSDTDRFTDTKVHRLFINVQHRITALIFVSAALTYEPSELQGRRGQPNIDEDTTRLGAGLSYLPTKNWLVGLNLDYDQIDSEDASRDLKRARVGLNARYSF